MNVEELLDKAADLLERDGFCQGELYDHATGRHCALGALCRMASPTQTLFGVTVPDTDRNLVDKAEAALRTSAAIPKKLSISEWNDRTPGPYVIAALREAAAKIRKYQTPEAK